VGVVEDLPFTRTLAMLVAKTLYLMLIKYFFFVKMGAFLGLDAKS
jgi:hypothetical protein